MRKMVSEKKLRLLLVGGGHGHVYVLKQLQQAAWDDVEVVLLSPSQYQYYSGMFSGYVEGLYQLEEICFDLAYLAGKARGKWIKGSAVRIDPKLQMIMTDQGEELYYDIVSFDIGSLTAGTSTPGVAQYAQVIKPTYLLPQVLQRLCSEQEIVIVGGGATGIELSLSLQSRRRKSGLPQTVTLVSSSELLQGYGHAVSRRVEGILRRKGIGVYTQQKVTNVEEYFIETASQYRIPYNTLLWVTGPAAHPIFRDSSLSVDHQGYLLVNTQLQAKDYPNIFGMGDCISIIGYSNVAKAGVYAVREASILWQNILNYMAGKTCISYHPQSDFLSILSTGDQQGLLLYKGMTFHGSWAWKLKRQIDKSFMKRYQNE